MGDWRVAPSGFEIVYRLGMYIDRKYITLLNKVTATGNPSEFFGSP